MSCYDNGFERAQREYDNRSDDSPFEDIDEIDEEILREKCQDNSEYVFRSERAFREMGKNI